MEDTSDDDRCLHGCTGPCRLYHGVTVVTFQRLHGGRTAAGADGTAGVGDAVGAASSML